MTIDPLEAARRRRAIHSYATPIGDAVSSADREISEKSEKSQADGGLISHNSLISQSDPCRSDAEDHLVRARERLRALRGIRSASATDRHAGLPDRGPPFVSSSDDGGLQAECELSEIRSGAPSEPVAVPDSFRAWRLKNAERLAEANGRFGQDYGGFCAAHLRVLSYPEQKRGACSWCVPVTPEREPEYWASHWRRYAEGR